MTYEEMVSLKYDANLLDIRESTLEEWKRKHVRFTWILNILRVNTNVAFAKRWSVSVRENSLLIAGKIIIFCFFFFLFFTYFSYLIYSYSNYVVAILSNFCHKNSNESRTLNNFNFNYLYHQDTKLSNVSIPGQYDRKIRPRFLQQPNPDQILYQARHRSCWRLW